MSFLTSLKNPPKVARYWIPIFYVFDPVTGLYTPYSPVDYLDIGQNWLCPLHAYDGIIVDYRCVVYDGDYNIIGSKDLYDIKVKDGQEFVFNWAGKGVSSLVLPIALVVGMGLALALVRKVRKK